MRKSITDKVLEALTSPEVLNEIIPVLSKKIGESLTTVIQSQVKDCLDSVIKPLSETIAAQQKTITDHEQKICRQFIQINSLERAMKDTIASQQERNVEIDALHRKIEELEFRVESQEQYSRRTSLRLHNITVPVDNRGNIKFPVDTDELALDVFNNKLGLNISINDIGRSHVIGKVRNGKSQIIVRFLSYRVRQQVYQSKRELKNDPDGIFITENLTQYRSNLTQKLANLKYNEVIYAYWTQDGRIFVKETENSRKRIVQNFNDIILIERRANLLASIRQVPSEDQSAMEDTESNS